MIKLFFVDSNVNVTEVDFQSWKFPAGEVGVKLSDTAIFNAGLVNEYQNCGFCIYWRFESNEEFFIIANLKDALRVEGANECSLVMPYVPYARQDRVCHTGESFGLKVFAELLNSLNFTDILAFDLHSDVAFKLIDNFADVKQNVCAADLPKYDYLIAPDKGASAKINTHRQVTDIENPTKVITLSKARVNDRIVYEDLPRGTIPSDARVCVVDDISDGNGTFIALASMLYETGNMGNVLDLYVTHGIFSKGVDNIAHLYSNVYTTNLMNKAVKDQVIQLLDPDKSIN